MKSFKIIEWCPIRGCFFSWVGRFKNKAEANWAIEYFGSVEEIEDAQTST